MSKPQSVGERIAQARRELAVRLHRDVLQSDVAEAIGVSGASVSQWESGIKSPREDTLAKLAAFLRVTPAYLRYGVTSPTMPLVAEPEPVARPAPKKATPRRRKAT